MHSFQKPDRGWNYTRTGESPSCDSPCLSYVELLGALKCASLSHFHIFHFLFSIIWMSYSSSIGEFLPIIFNDSVQKEFPLWFPSSGLLQNLDYMMAYAALQYRVFQTCTMHSLKEGIVAHRSTYIAQFLICTRSSLSIC